VKLREEITNCTFWGTAVVTGGTVVVSMKAGLVDAGSTAVNVTLQARTLSRSKPVRMSL
jgi:hypothetical protein